MTPDQLIIKLITTYPGLVLINTYGEKSLFYNPNSLLPKGVYFATVKEQDGQNDKASKLDRDNVFRLSFGLGKDSYEKLFGTRPQRPNKGGIVNTGHDFTKLNILSPHPIYAWLHWVAILNPDSNSFDVLKPLFDENYKKTVKTFNDRIKKL